MGKTKDTKDEIAEINKELRESRKDVRMCDRIMTGIEIVKNRLSAVEKLELDVNIES